MFTTALFVVEKAWKKSECHSEVCMNREGNSIIVITMRLFKKWVRYVIIGLGAAPDM